MNLRYKSALFLAVGLAGILDLGAALVVDTGTPSEISPPWTFSNDQYFAAKFSLSENSTITSVESYLNNVGFVQSPFPGEVTFSLHASDGGSQYVPGSILQSATVAISPGNWSDFQWRGAYGLNWAVSAGSYWISLVPDATLFRGALSYAPMSPLPPEHYAIGARGAWLDVGYWGWDSVKVPLRVDATTTSVPETGSTLGLLFAAICSFAAGSVLPKNRRKQDSR